MTQYSPYLRDAHVSEDKLNFSDFRPALKQALTGAQTPLTIGVFGPWGTGKTSLLKMLSDDVRQMGEAYRCVWFTAWKYDRQEALWRAFILRVLDALYPRDPGSEPWEVRPRTTEPTGKGAELVKTLDRLEQSLYRPVEWQEAGRLAADWGKLLPEAGKAAGVLAEILLPGGGMVRKLINTLAGADDVDEPEFNTAISAIRREVHKHRREQLSSMEQFEETFKEAVKLALGETNEGRLVVFVDDLDRCLPEKAVEVLEAIKLFLEVPGTVFVLGLDSEVVRRGIEARYASLFQVQGYRRRGSPVNGAVYLQKIIQIPFYLPPLGVPDITKYIERLEDDIKPGKSDPPRGALGSNTKGVIARGVFPNPRQVKRVLNIFNLLREIASARESNGSLTKPVAWPLLAKAVLIQTQWPELYEEWRLRPTLVQSLEQAYEERPSSDSDVLEGWSDEEKAGRPALSGGILRRFLTDRQTYSWLEKMLQYPKVDQPGEGRELARFGDLPRKDVEIYVTLAGTAEGTEGTRDAARATPATSNADALREDLLSGDLARIREAVGLLKEQSDHRKETLRTFLCNILSDGSRAVQQRTSAGVAVGLLGDPRFKSNVWHLPAEPTLGFLRVRGGEFKMGADNDTHTTHVPEFFVSRWPVTVEQYRAFVNNDDGHQPNDRRALEGIGNHPVVHVTWHEALAYCKWLNARLRELSLSAEMTERIEAGTMQITLPSEAEWEIAARGQQDERLFPWGDDPDADKANYGETGLSARTAVGCFPGGRSPVGCEDMSGNVWEWTRSLWGSYPYPEPGANRQEREDLLVGGDRVLRGGAFGQGPALVSCAYRDFRDSQSHYAIVGFRVVLSELPITTPPGA